MAEQVQPRARKKSEIYVPEFAEKKAFAVEKGTGTPLGDIPYISVKIRGIKAGDRNLLAELHRLFFARAGKARTQAKNVLEFSGFPQEDLEVVVARRKAKIEKLSTTILKRLMDLLEINRSAKSFSSGKANKADLVSRFLQWITVPTANPPKIAKEAKAKKSTKTKPTKAKQETKKKVASAPNKSSENALDPDEQQETAVQGKVKKATKAPTKPRRKTSTRKRWFEASEYMLRGLPEGVAKRKAAKKEKRKRSEKKTKSRKTAAKKAKVAPKAEPLSAELQEIKQTVFEILEVVDKTKMTMREVRKQTEEKLGKPLVQHKAAIKLMVQEFFAG